jgi:hypothetical protein
MKAPLMVFMYGAGKSSIANTIGTEAADEFIHKLSQDDNAEIVEHTKAILKERKKHFESMLKQRKATKKQINYAKWQLTKIEKALKWVDVASKTEGMFKNTSLTEYNSPMQTIYDAVNKEMQEVYGEMVGNFLEEEFENVVTLRRAINEVITGAFGVFKAELDERLAKKVGDGTPSKEDIDTTIQELAAEGKIPGILTIDGTEADNKIPVLDTAKKTVDYGDMRSVVPWTKGPKIRLHPLVYDYVAKPTAGAVVNIHALDGAIISRLINEKIGLGIHDAVVSHVNDVHENAALYNKSVIDLTLSMDMANRVKDELGKVMAHPAFVQAINDSRQEIGIELIVKEDIPKYLQEQTWFFNMVSDRVAMIKEEMKKAGITSAHMAGPEGSTYTLAPSTKRKRTPTKLDKIIADVLKVTDVKITKAQAKTIEAILAGNDKATAKEKFDIIVKEVINCKG